MLMPVRNVAVSLTTDHGASRSMTLAVVAISPKMPPSTPIMANAALCKAGISRSAGITHGDTAVPKVDCSAQRRADTHLRGDACQNERFDAALGQHLL